MPSLTALCDLVLSRSSTQLTCVPLAAVEHIPSAAHLLPFCFVLRLHLLTGHVATEASLDLGSSPVGLWVIQRDVHDVLLLLGPAAILLLRGPKSSSLSQKGSRLHDYMFFSLEHWWENLTLNKCDTIFCYLYKLQHYLLDSEGCVLVAEWLALITWLQWGSQEVNNPHRLLFSLPGSSCHILYNTLLAKTRLSQPIL